MCCCCLNSYKFNGCLEPSKIQRCELQSAVRAKHILHVIYFARARILFDRLDMRASNHVTQTHFRLNWFGFILYLSLFKWRTFNEMQLGSTKRKKSDIQVSVSQKTFKKWHFSDDFSTEVDKDGRIMALKCNVCSNNLTATCIWKEA